MLWGSGLYPTSVPRRRRLSPNRTVYVWFCAITALARWGTIHWLRRKLGFSRKDRESFGSHCGTVSFSAPGRGIGEPECHGGSGAGKPLSGDQRADRDVLGSATALPDLGCLFLGFAVRSWAYMRLRIIRSEDQATGGR